MSFIFAAIIFADVSAQAASPADPSAGSAPTIEKPAAANEAPSWRRRRRARYKNLSKRKREPPKRRGPVVHLTGRWLQENKEALEKMIFDLGFPAPGEAEPDIAPAAVFMLDDVSTIHHAGEAVFYRAVTHAEFKFDDAFWRLLPPPHNYKIRMGYDGFKDLPRAVRPRDPFFMMYRKSMFEAYRDLCADQGKKVCHAWLASLFQDFKEQEIGPYMKDAVDGETKRRPDLETVIGDVGDPKPLRVPFGLEIVPEMKQLIAELSKHGFEVRLLSSSNQWAAEILGDRLGVAADRVDGIRMKIVAQTVTAETEQEIPEGAGALAVATSRLGRYPALVVATQADKELLDYGAGLRLVIVPAVPGVPPPARMNGRLVQPAFNAAPALVPAGAGAHRHEGLLRSPQRRKRHVPDRSNP